MSGKLTVNTTPAERRIGCIFSEKFENQTAVVENGGTVTGALSIDNGTTFDGATNYITYSNVKDLGSENFSFNFKVSFPSAGTQEYLFAKWEDNDNRWYVRREAAGQIFMYCLVGGNIRISAISAVGIADANTEYDITIVGDWADTIRFYINRAASVGTVTTFTNDDITNTGSLEVGHVSTIFGEFTIENLKIFNQALTPTQIIDAYNNETYDYRNLALVDHPMTAATHDPTNVRTLDVSGNGHNAQFGDGSTSTTYPTKLAKRGYSFDGTTDYFNLGSDTIGTGVGTFAVAFKATGWGEGNSGRLFDNGKTLGFVDSSARFRFSSDAAGSEAATANGSLSLGKRYVIIVTRNSSNNSDIWVNGTRLISDDSSGAPVAGDNNVIIGNRLAGDRTFDGDIYMYQQYDFVLTPTQIADLSIDMFEKLNKI